ARIHNPEHLHVARAERVGTAAASLISGNAGPPGTNRGPPQHASAGIHSDGNGRWAQATDCASAAFDPGRIEFRFLSEWEKSGDTPADRTSAAIRIQARSVPDFSGSDWVLRGCDRCSSGKRAGGSGG